MKDKWFEDDFIKCASNLKGLNSTREHAQCILKVAEKRLEQNLGNLMIVHDSSGFSGLEISYTKHQERRKLKEVIYIVENYVTNGNFSMPPYREYTMKIYLDEYTELKQLLASIIEPDLINESSPNEQKEALMASIESLHSL